MAKVSCSPSNNTHALTLQATRQMILAPGGGWWNDDGGKSNHELSSYAKEKLVYLQGMEWKKFDRG